MEGCAMGQILHGSATTTKAVRRAIQNSQESLRALAKRYGVNPKTVEKWKKRASTAWIQGVSTRKVDDLVQAMGMSGISKSQVSKLCEDIDERVNSFLDRKLEGDWPYLWLDATYLKVRENGRIVSVAAIIASAVNAEGRREIIGLALVPSEAAVFWLGFLRSLESHGLKGVKLVISDAHEGLKAAI